MEGDNPIYNTEDVIDSRDVIARIERLEDLGTPEEGTEEPGDNEFTGLDQDEANELEDLRALRDEAAGYAPDWEYGATLIRDTYFEDYARELAEDIGAIDREYSWPASHIDWEAAADALRIDYTSVEFDGITYWVR